MHEQLNDINPSIHFLYRLIYQGRGETGANPSIFGWEAGYILDRSPVKWY